MDMENVKKKNIKYFFSNMLNIKYHVNRLYSDDTFPLKLEGISADINSSEGVGD